jgi:hypothetical protein
MTKLVAGLKRLSRQHTPARRDRRVTPRFECLEGRLVPAVTDMTQLAALFPTHNGPTTLYLNFDGWANAGHRIHAFETEAGDTAANRDRDIQDVLFQTSEMFAPFNVEIRRTFGNAHFDQSNGNTTVFVGGDEDNVNNDGLKVFRGFTSTENTDYPKVGDLGFSDATFKQSAPHSHPFNLAFVDPVGLAADGKTWITENLTPLTGANRFLPGGEVDTLEVARAIAHEAGHTFGLAHVLTDAAAGVSPAGQDQARRQKAGSPDMMSYNDKTPNRYFANQAFDVTGLNFDATKVTGGDPATGYTIDHDSLPGWHGSVIATQNSYTYLRQALGARPADGRAHVADGHAVDPTYRDGAMTTVGLGSAVTGSLNRFGDYDAYDLAVTGSTPLYVRVAPQAFAATSDRYLGKARPVILLYRFDHLSATTSDTFIVLQAETTSGTLQVAVPPGHYRLVVGAVDGGWKGGYELFVEGNAPPAPRLQPQTISAPSHDYITGATYPGMASGSINYRGQFDVYQLRPVTDHQVVVQVQQLAAHPSPSPAVSGPVQVGGHGVTTGSGTLYSTHDNSAASVGQTAVVPKSADGNRGVPSPRAGLTGPGAPPAAASVSPLSHPVVMVYDDTGALVARGFDSTLSFHISAGHTYTIVVGGQDNQYTGAYQLLVADVGLSRAEPRQRVPALAGLGL